MRRRSLRGRRMRVRLLAVAAVGVVLVAGCGSESKDTNTPTATAGSSGAQVEIGNTINYGSFGTTADIDCADGKSLNIGGAHKNPNPEGAGPHPEKGGAPHKGTPHHVEKRKNIFCVETKRHHH